MAPAVAAKSSEPPKTRGRKQSDLLALDELETEWAMQSRDVIDGATVIIMRARRKGRQSIGTAVAAARMSTSDRKSGLTVAAQVGEVLGFAKSRGLHVGHIVISTECSGARDYVRRPDLLAIERLIVEGWCTAVVWREVSRITRDRQTFLDHGSVMEATKTPIYIAQSGKVIEWDNIAERLMMAMLLEWAVVERAQTKARTAGGIWSNCIATGKGVINHPVFGFTKTADGWMVPCPKRWKWATFIHHAYGAIKLSDTTEADLVELLAERGKRMSAERVAKILGNTREASGLRALTKLLNHCGIALCAPAIDNILRDSIYVDGRFTQVHAGIEIEMKPIDLADPLDPECFVLNQHILCQPQGTWSKRRVGEQVLSGLLRCGECGGSMRMDTGKRDGTVRYRCSTTDGTCSRPIIDAGALDRCVVRTVRRLEQKRGALESAWKAGAEIRDEAVEAWEEARLSADVAERLDYIQDRLGEIAERLTAVDEECESDADLAARFVAGGGVELVSEIARLRRAKEANIGILQRRRHRTPVVMKPDQRLSRSLLKTLTVKLPDDKGARLFRASVMREAVSAVVVTPIGDSPGEFDIRIEGALTPLEKDLHFPVPPSQAARAALEKLARTVNCP